MEKPSMISQRARDAAHRAGECVILDAIRVEVYGAPTPVNQLGTVTVPEPTLLVISPWDRVWCH